MSYLDGRGLSHTGTPGPAADLCERALTHLMRFKGDPMGLCDQALQQDPDCLQAGLIQAHALAFSLHPKLMHKAAAQLVKLRSAKANERETSHMDALECWLNGRFDDAAIRLGAITERWPTDLLALMFVHQADFFSSATTALRHRPERVLQAMPEGMPGRGFVIGMAAFGHEEAGDYGRAAELAHQALDLDPEDVWAIHAMAHVLEMQGLDEDGISWYRRHEPIWSQDCFFACHNWWHLALYHIDRMEDAEALAIFDQEMVPDKRSITLNLCDAAALLWRLQLHNVDIGQRMAQVAELFARQIDTKGHVFNDVHAGLAFAATHRHDDFNRLEARLLEDAKAENRYGQMLRRAGIPAIRAFREFASARYAKVVEELALMMPNEALMTGSHAQRDLLPLTLIEAQLRAGDHLAAQSAIQQRLRAKPTSAKWQREASRV